ncbi:MAG: dihydroorotase [Flavobacteriaceae bacterium]|nr:dihydroorotase [Flavobacteriaceae bacterium]MBL6684318.1 dihydroorotase [Flavobacteriaceae bacterium]
MKFLIKNINVVESKEIKKLDILVKGKFIYKIDFDISEYNGCTIIDGSDKFLFPGIIDDQVHFREPGLSHKGTIFSESRAAVAGGVTSYFEMPNTNPQTTTIENLKSKFEIAANNSLANFSFMFGGTNSNLSEIKKLDFNKIPGIKLFLGSSTGDMLVDDYNVIEDIMRFSKVPVVVHSEDEGIIKKNLNKYVEKYGNNIPIEYHPKIRSEEACLKSTLRIIDLAKKCNSRLHVFHLSTKSESKLFEILPLENKNITSEVCIHHLSFNDLDYKEKGALIKWNPAVKSQLDQDALWDALNSGRIDIVATDHAPHTLKEKQNNYLNCPSGGPLVQHSLIVMYEHYLNKKITLQKIVEKMCNNPAKIFKINKRGYIREGYYADLVILDPNKKQTIGSNNILYKCGWSPFEGKTFNSVITHTFVNGHLAFNNGNLDDSKLGMKINFNNEN